MPLVTVGCKLPNGLVLESGYKLENGSIVRTDKYTRVMLAGANQRVAQLVEAGGVPVAPRDLMPGITDNVDEGFFDQWVKDHADSNIVRNNLIWKVKNRNEAAAAAKTEVQRKIGLESFDASDKSKVKNVTKFNADE